MKPRFNLQSLDDAINPIVIKELRQAVSGRFISAVLMLFLLVCVICLVIALAQQDMGLDSSAGQEVMSILNGVLLVTCIFVLPIFTAVRLSGERSAQNIDLMYITTLKPRSIIWGKLAASIAVAALIYAACMPFMTLSYLLRGIDLPTIFLTLGMGFGIVILALMFSIFTACASSGRGFRVLMGLAMLIALAVGLGTTISGSTGLIMFGAADLFTDDEALWAAGLFLLTLASAVWLLYTWAVALITSPSANRARPVRWTMTTLWFINSLATWAFAIATDDGDVLGVWAIFSTYYFCIGMFIAVCERDTWGPRVREQIPTSSSKRFLAFITYSGSAGGMLWAWLSILLVLLSLGGVCLASEVIFGIELWSDLSGRDEIPESLVLSAGFAVYFYCYAGTAQMLRRKIFSHIVAPSHTWALGLVLGAVAITLPLLVLILVRGGDWYSGHEMWMIANPASLVQDDSDLRNAGLMFSGIWALILTVNWLPGALAQYRDFRPLEAIHRG